MGGELEPGTILFNKYRVETAIGRGGFGAVYKAVDTRLGRVVAIKTLLYGQTSIDDRYGSGTFDVYLDRFKREAIVSSYFTSNKHIITVYGLEEDDESNYYLVLEYLEGGSLTELIKKEGALPLRRSCQIALDICTALADIHNHPADIVHRDLKPGNILLRSNGTAVLADFGVAQVGQESHRTVFGDRPRHPGSPPYKSPEQASNYDYLTPASDLYSLGLLLYEMLTAKLYAKFKKMPPSLVNPQVPDWLDEIVIGLLQKEPDDRYQQAEEVIEALEAGLAQLTSDKELETEPLGLKPKPRSREKVSPTPRLEGNQNEVALIAKIEREAEEAERQHQAEAALKIQREKEAREEAARQVTLKKEVDEERRRQAEAAWREQAQKEVQERQKRPSPASAEKAQPVKDVDAELRRKAEVAPQIIYLLSQMSLAETQHDWDKVIRQGERVLELDADHLQATMRTATAYWQRGLNFYNKDDYHQALPDFNRAIQLNPHEVAYYFERSKSFIKNGDYEQAIADLSHAIRLDPNKVEYYYWRGVCYHHQRFFTGKGDYDWAIADYGRAIRIEPNNADYYWRRGISYGCKGNYQQAISDYNRAIELKPCNGQYYYSRGLAYRSIVDREASWRDFKRSAELGYADAKKELAKF